MLEPVGTAPGLVVPPREPATKPTIGVLPGPPRELQPMWGQAVQTEALQAAISGATEYRQAMFRLYGIPESEIAETLRLAEAEGVELDRLEVTTCLKRGEVEVVTRYEPGEQGMYGRVEAVVRARTPTRCSPMTGAPSTIRWRSCCGGWIPPTPDGRDGGYSGQVACWWRG